jgi:molybdopterin-guanine dinucleotide biosynthesis protein A
VFDAIVLAGGAARRLGGADKPAQQVGDRSMLEHVVRAVSGAGRTVVVGPRRELGHAVQWRREYPVGAGPVAAAAAGLSATSAPTVVLLAADLPQIGPAIAPLLTAVDGGADVALLVDATGRVNHLAGAWRRPTLAAALQLVRESLGSLTDAPMRAVVAAAGEPTLVPDAGGWGRDCDTWDDLVDARERFGRRQAGG